MATLSLLCRLKVLSTASIASSNELSRSLLIKSNNDTERSSCLPNEGFANAQDEAEENASLRHDPFRSAKVWTICTSKNISRYQSPRRILITINGDRLPVISKFVSAKDTFDEGLSSKNTYTKLQERFADTKRNVRPRTFLFDERSSIVSQFTLATIYHAWRLSKQSCPSTNYLCSSVRQISNSTYRLHCVANDPTREKCLPREASTKMKNSYETSVTTGYKSNRSYSSSSPPSDKESPCKKESKPQECPAEPVSENRKLFEDMCAVKKPAPCELKPPENPCPDTTRPCKPLIEDPAPVCTTSPCPNIEDFCRDQESYKEAFWKILVCFVALPLLIVMSIYVYSRETEKKKQPRPKFEDVPWMRIMVKPFPWGDGKHSLFHNPEKNPISPHGYEAEDPAVAKKDQKK